jgi:hypothetical protein
MRADLKTQTTLRRDDYTRLPGGGGHTAGREFGRGNSGFGVADDMFDSLRIINSSDNKKK